MDTEKAHMSEKASAVSVHVESYDGEQAHTGHTKRVLNARQVQVCVYSLSLISYIN